MIYRQDLTAFKGMSDSEQSAGGDVEVTLLLLAIGTIRDCDHSGAVTNRDLAALGMNQPPIFEHLESGGR
ncbi:hypothetical protein FJ970_25495 [Mesorhizobium sp. B2-1-8]|uniref:hypothetical protein n=1 Tax=Mesorhizobium sp. B2-1-8 TaxID=2589967 RepID=UPI0015E449D7|nr:hypothetical protein [Mesorhizobium sp. B2-1-8]UCI18395.1 hypothetical protein FJ970_25495 [Mesorhizobium sp. B2-1-8]